MELTEFAPGSDRIVAAFNSELSSGESFGPPICIGFYVGEAEVFIQHGDQTANLQASDVDAFCKQMKRAAKLAKDQS